MMQVQGLVPYLPPARPRDTPRWWHARGALDGDTLRVELGEADAAPPVTAPCGLAAPCSLPPAFLDFLGVRRSLDVEGPPDRILRRARAFAAAAKRGQRQPLRVPHESLPSLDRRRLSLFLLAALPLLRGDAASRIFEVDAPAILDALGLPHAGLSGAAPAAVDARARVLAAFAGGALGFRVETAQRDYAVASLPALAAVVACAMAARVQRDGARRPADAETWVPVP